MLFLLFCYFGYFIHDAAIVLFLLFCYFHFSIHDAAIVLFLLFCYFQFVIHDAAIVLFLLFCYFQFSILILCYFCYFALLDHPFLRNLAKKGSLGAKILLDNVKFMVDLWPCEKHKEATCMPYLDNPKCIYHPNLFFVLSSSLCQHRMCRTSI